MHHAFFVVDVLLLILRRLETADVARLSRCCRALRRLAAPELLRNVDLDLYRMKDVYAYASKFSNFRCVELHVHGTSDPGLNETDARRAGRDRRARASFSDACSFLGRFLSLISRHKTLNLFAWKIQQPYLVPSFVWTSLAASSRLQVLNLTWQIDNAVTAESREVVCYDCLIASSIVSNTAH